MRAGWTEHACGEEGVEWCEERRWRGWRAGVGFRSTRHRRRVPAARVQPAGDPALWRDEALAGRQRGETPADKAVALPPPGRAREREGEPDRQRTEAEGRASEEAWAAGWRQ